MQSDFDYGILNEVSHRPWPMPQRPWVMTQSWHDLLFAHWPIDRSILEARIPANLELDLFDGEAWLGIVPFRMSNVAPRGIPAIPWMSAFPELNVRTYVRVGDKPGVYFFSLDAANPIAVFTASALFSLPYYAASMAIESDGTSLRYRSRRRTGAPPAEFVASYEPVGPVFHAVPGTFDYFLTERYCLYTAIGSARPRRLEIHHPVWPLQRAAASFAINTMAEASGIALPTVPPVLHFAKRQDVVAWLPTRVEPFAHPRTDSADADAPRRARVSRC